MASSDTRPGVLFLCTGNSARSLMAESALRRHFGHRFAAHSAGTHPRPEPHPLTLEVLRREGHDTSALRPKSWEDFTRRGAPRIDFVFTVCDDARDEVCPAWPGRPLTAHWGIPDPARAEGSRTERLACFRRAYVELEHKVRRFARLPLQVLDRGALTAELASIGAA